MRPKRLHGEKLHTSKFEPIVIEWLIEEPRLSSRAIAIRLKKQYDFKITSPSVRDWKKHYFPTDPDLHKQILERVKNRRAKQKEFVNSVIMHGETTLQYLQDTVRFLEERVDLLASEQKRFTEQGKLIHFKIGRGEDARIESVAVRDVNMEIERMINSLVRTIADIKEKIHEYTGGIEYGRQVEEYIGDAAEVALKELVPLIPERSRKEAAANFNAQILKLVDRVKEELDIGKLKKMVKEEAGLHEEEN